MNIVVLGWGSLLWDQRNLRIRSVWNADGPALPIEFARISHKDRLTLVIEPGSPLQTTYWSLSEFTDLIEARKNLQERESISDDEMVHSVDSLGNRIGKIENSVIDIVLNWLKNRDDVHAAVWTGLVSNWISKRGRDFSLEDALSYLRHLIEKNQASAAKNYVRKASASIRTPLRKLIEDEFGWTCQNSRAAMPEINCLSWRDHILKEFTPKISKLTLVADPDGLLLEEGILEGIRERGFELIPFDDHISFRYAYESKFRSRWDRGEQTELVVVLRSQASELASLPYDLLQAGRKLSFSLGDIFPYFSYPILTTLDRSDLDALYDAQIKHNPGQLGDNATKEFVLRHVFEIAPELIKQPSDLLRVLIRRHYQGQKIPSGLDERFIQILRHNKTFNDWPLEKLVPDREAFFAFLQDRWPIFLNRLTGRSEKEVREARPPYGLAVEGPIDLPFDHNDIRVYIDNLFLEGILHSVSNENAAELSKTWMIVGVRIDPVEDRARRLAKLIESIQNRIPEENARYEEWLLFARRWAEMRVLACEKEDGLNGKTILGLESLQTQVDNIFIAWLAKRYSGLINLPPVKPVMVHHIPRCLARHLEADCHARVALLLVDGLSLDEWIIVREALTSKRSNLCFRENAVFAWIPSITSTSRQALLAGKPPIYFPNCILTTDREPNLWTQFWVDQGRTPDEVIYTKGLGDGSLDDLEELISHPKTRVAGLVIDKVDKIMHGMELGTAGMHNQVRQWALQPYLGGLISLLLERDFRVFLASDHGNIEAEGCGRPSEGVIPELRGERVRIYSDELLRKRTQEKFLDSMIWPSIGLPEDYFVLLAPDRCAFIQVGERRVSHGAISIEELIVPFIEIERNSK